MKQTYKVVMTTQSDVEFEIPECNSPDQAIAIAEEWFADGEDGEVISEDVINADAFPIEEEEA